MKRETKVAVDEEQRSGGSRAILDAAASLFSCNGFGSVSIAQIADGAQVSKANVFHHFRSKEALYCDVIRAAADGHAQFAEGLLAADLPAAEKIRRLIDWDLKSVTEGPAKAKLLMREFVGEGCDRSQQLARNTFRRNFSAVVQLFAQGQDSGAFRRDFDPAVAATLLGSTCSMYAQMRDTLRNFPEFKLADDVAAYGRAVADMLLASLMIPVRSPRTRSPTPRPRAAVRPTTKKTRSLR